MGRRLHRRALLGGAIGGVGMLAARHGATSAFQTEASPVATPSGCWQGRTVRVGAWGGEVQAALRAAIFEPFAAETGCNLLEVFTDYDRIATDGAYADALVVDPIWAVTAFDDDLVEPIAGDVVDRTLFGPVAVTDWSVPAYAYALVSAFRRDAVARLAAPADWAEWWDVGRYAARRALPRQALGTFEFALLADGVSPGDLYPLDVERAIASLGLVRGEVDDRWWDDGMQPIAWLSRNRADFAAAWHYRVIAGQQDGRDVDFVWNQGLLFADHWAVPRGARNQDVAFDLIRYATTPEAQTALAQAVPLGPVTPAAYDVLSPADARLLPTAPGNVEMLLTFDAGWWAINRADAEARFETWLTEADTNE